MKAFSIHSFLLALAMTATCGTSSAAVVIADFTGGTGPAQNWDLSGLTTTMDPAPGTGNWATAPVFQYWGNLPIPAWAAGGSLSIANLNSNSTLAFDVIFPSATWLKNSAIVSVQFRTGDPNTAIFSTSTTVDLTGLKDQILHLEFDYSSAGPFADPANWGPDLSINIHPGYDWMWDTANNPGATAYTNQTFHIDNIALVPEPASALLGAIGCLFLLRRRRH